MKTTVNVLFKTANAARLCSGQFIGFNNAITNVQISSSNCSEGSLFIALKGTNTDGHNYINAAIQMGARSIMVDYKHYNLVARDLRTKAIGIIIVNDTLFGLQKLGENYIAQFSITKMGITGSCGKTTTKEILNSILTQMGNTSATPGNLNSEIGLALSVFTANSKTNFGVYEMGVDKIGEMDRSRNILKPDLAMITNIYSSHLEKFKTVNNLVKEKSKIFDSCDNNFLYEDCKYKNSVINFSKAKNVKFFGISSLPGLTNYQDLGLNGWILNYCNKKIHIKVIGWHSLMDCIAAIKVARELGANINDIAEGLENVNQVNGRSKVYRNANTVIDDSYNANLQSGTSILNLVKNLQWEGSKKLVMGSMKELGYKSKTDHIKLAKKMSTVNATKIYLYGDEMEDSWDYLKRIGQEDRVFFTKDFNNLKNEIVPEIKTGDLFLLKGSRSMRLERLLPLLDCC